MWSTAVSSAAVRSARFDRSDLARVVVRGPDASDFLHRLATNDIASLSAGQGTVTLLLERTGRVVDRLLVSDRGGEFLLVGSAGRGPAVRDWIEKYIIAEDVSAEDVGSDTRLFTVLGAEAPGVLARSFGVSDLAPWAHRTVEHAGSEVTVIRAEEVGGASFHVLAAEGGAAQVLEALGELPEGTPSEYRALCVRSGVPGFGTEFTERTIPLEAGMIDAISFTKGCYIGQEVIARLHNHDRVKRALVRLRVEGAGAPAEGAKLVEGGDEVGVITSAAAFDDAVYALGYVRSGREAPGGRLAVDDHGTAREAEVLSLTPAGEPS